MSPHRGDPLPLVAPEAARPPRGWPSTGVVGAPRNWSFSCWLSRRPLPIEQAAIASAQVSARLILREPRTRAEWADKRTSTARRNRRCRRAGRERLTQRNFAGKIGLYFLKQVPFCISNKTTSLTNA